MLCSSGWPHTSDRAFPLRPLECWDCKHAPPCLATSHFNTPPDLTHLVCLAPIPPEFQTCAVWGWFPGILLHLLALKLATSSRHFALVWLTFEEFSGRTEGMWSLGHILCHPNSCHLLLCLWKLVALVLRVRCKMTDDCPGVRSAF